MATVYRSRRFKIFETLGDILCFIFYSIAFFFCIKLSNCRRDINTALSLFNAL